MTARAIYNWLGAPALSVLFSPVMSDCPQTGSSDSATLLIGFLWLSDN